jgi:ankyrin repeat protein
MTIAISTANPQDYSTINVSEEIKNEDPQPAIPNEQKPSLQVYDNYTLERAAQNGDLEGVKYLMGKEDRILYEIGWALGKAAREGHHEIVKYLIEFKDKSLPEKQYKGVPIAKVWQKRGCYWLAEEALDRAIDNSHFEVIKYLLQQRIGKFSKVLSRAVRAVNYDIVRCLVEHIGELTRIKKGALDQAAYDAVLKGHLDILKYLVEQGANINTTYGTRLYTPKESALAAACRLGKREIIKYLVEQGADIHAQYERALCNAALSGDLDIVIFLVEHGADIHAQEEQALYEAVYKGHLHIVKYLVEQGADIHAQEERALICACRLDRFEIAKYLVEQGADITTQNEEALKEAIRKGSLALIKYLVIHEAIGM